MDFKVRSGGIGGNAPGSSAAVGGQPKILGWDAAGVVLAAGPEALFKAGDEVYYAGSIIRSGTYAQQQLVDSRIAGRKPKSLGWGAAAAFPLVTLTAYESLFDRLRIAKGPDAAKQNAGKSLLILNASGGVGSLAVQLAKKLAPGLTVIGTAGKPESKEWVQKLGADHVISHYEPLQAQIAAAIGGAGQVDYIYVCHDTVSVWPQLVEIVKPQGAINTIVLLPGEGSKVDLMPLYMKSVAVSTEAMYTRSLFNTADIAEQNRLLTEVAELVDSGIIQAVETKSLGSISAASITAGHKLLEEGHVIGKLTAEGW